MAASTAAVASATAIGCMRYEPSPGRSTSPPSIARSTAGTKASPGPTTYEGRNTTA